MGSSQTDKGFVNRTVNALGANATPMLPGEAYSVIRNVREHLVRPKTVFTIQPCLNEIAFRQC